jgi:hypothetical protein
MNTVTATDAFSHRLGAVQARGRVAQCLLAVALDLVEPFASEYLSREAYQEVSDLLRGPAETATEMALATLIGELVRVATAGDPRVAPRVRGSIERPDTRWTPWA